MNKEEAIQLFKCLSDKSRLSILECLSKEDMYVEKIAEILSLAPSTVSFHLKKMVDEKILVSYKDQYYTMFQINKETLDQNILGIISGFNGVLIDKKDVEYRKNVINTFIVSGKLVQIPVQRKKRRIILEYMLQSFEKGRKYTEKEVNLIIADYHDDFCFLRREMIGEGLMERENSIYWVKEVSKQHI